jgi:Polysaccharide lyase 14
MRKQRWGLGDILILLVSILSTGRLAATECDNWQNVHPEWIWCDSFELDTPLNSRYEDVRGEGLGRSTADAVDGRASLQQTYTTGQVSAGWVVKVKPEGYPDHIFYRWYHKFGEGYSSFPPKMARVGYRQRSGTWQEVFRVHSWIAGNNPTLDVLASNSTQGPWLPVARSTFDLSLNSGKWNSYEVEVKLNSSGSSDGHYRLWINNDLVVERINVDLRGSTTDKINEVMLDAYWNGGATANLERFYDNFIISTQKIGPIKGALSPPLAPGNLSIQEVLN